MAGSTNKKVVVYRFERSALAGYLDPGAPLDPEVELLSPAGELQRIPLADVKALCFVREFDGGSFDAENRRFRNRPKSEGLWVQLQFRDNDVMEGIAANNLAALDGKTVAITPPDAASNNTRIVAPRAALKLCKVMGVIGGPNAKRKAEPAPGQVSLFD